MHSYILLLALTICCGTLNFSCQNQQASDENAAMSAKPTHKEELIVPEDKNKDFIGPKLTLTSQEGRKVAVYEYEAFAEAYLQRKDENTYVLNFWATWCAPCVEELPLFFALEQKLKDQSVKFVFVSFDDLKRLEAKLLPFLDERKIDSEIIVLDQKGINDWIENIDPDWSGSIPATLVYDKDSRRFYEEKFENEADVEAIVK